MPRSASRKLQRSPLQYSQRAEAVDSETTCKTKSDQDADLLVCADSGVSGMMLLGTATWILGDRHDRFIHSVLDGEPLRALLRIYAHSLARSC